MSSCLASWSTWPGKRAEAASGVDSNVDVAGKKLTIESETEELLGVITKVDVAGKKLTIESEKDGKEVMFSTTGDTELVSKKGIAKIDIEKLSNVLAKQQAAGKKGFRAKVILGKGVASKIDLVPKKAEVAEESLGVLTKVDVAGKKLTVELENDGKQVMFSTTGDTEFVTKKGNAKIDMEKLSNGLTKQQAAGKKGIRVKVMHAKGVASRIDALPKKAGN